MRILLISGDGRGAGKSTFARRTTHSVMGLADAIRTYLTRIYPKYDWFNRSQAYKDNTIVDGVGKCVRDVMIDVGESRCKGFKAYWAREWVNIFTKTIQPYILQDYVVAVDDLRKLCELEYLRAKMPQYQITHYHVESANATPEPLYENAELRVKADYRVRW